MGASLWVRLIAVLTAALVVVPSAVAEGQTAEVQVKSLSGNIDNRTSINLSKQNENTEASRGGPLQPINTTTTNTTTMMMMMNEPERRYRRRLKSSSLPEFSAPIGNITAVLGRDTRLICTVEHLGQYQVSFVLYLASIEVKVFFSFGLVRSNGAI